MNNKQTIYVVIAYGGEYDDAWESNVCAKYSRDDAELEVLELKQRREKLKTIHQPVQDAFYARCSIQEPMEEVPNSPKGPSKSTKENMRLHWEAVDAWRAVARPIIERNQERENRAHQAAVEAARNKAIELGADEFDLKQLGFSKDNYNDRYHPSFCNFNCDYKIEELELS